MASEQSMRQAIMKALIVAAKAIIMAVRETDTPVNTTRQAPVVIKTGGLVLKQPMFNWKSPDRHIEAKSVASGKTTQIKHRDFSNVFAGIGCSKDMFSLHIKDGTKSCQTLPRCMAYALQEPFRKELSSLQDQ